MALQKAILDPQTGVVAIYWRIVILTIAPADYSARIVLGGYTSKDVRMGGGIPVDQRAYDLGLQQFIALAQSVTAGPTLFDAIGGSSYEYIVKARRLVEIYNPETGEGAVGGVTYPAEQIVNLGTEQQPVWTAPSEFADADAV